MRSPRRSRDDLQKALAGLARLFLANDKPAIRKALLRLRYLDKFAEEARARRTNLEREVMTLLEIHEPGETPLPHAGEGTLAVGIDLGTTNSVVAIAREGKPAALHDETGKALVPSVVAYPAAGGVLVGDAARALTAQEPKNVVASIKRLMGRGAADLHAVAGVLPYEIEPGTGQTDMVKLRIGGKARSPVEISAEILKALKGPRRSRAGEAGRARGHHRAGLLRRCRAHRDARCRARRRPRSAAPGQRADGGGAGLRPR